jgi:cytochrome P450
MRDKLTAVTRYAREYGDLVALRLGPMRLILVSDPDLIEQVFVSRAREFNKGAIEQLVRPSVGNGILLSEGDYWKRQRRMVAPPFHRQKLAGYGEVMVGITDRMTSGFADGEVRDMFPVTTNIALAVAAKTMFAVEVDRDADGLGEALTAMMRAVNARVNAAVPLPDFVPTPTMLRLKRARAKLDTVLYRAIAERRAAATPGDDLLSLLLSVRDEDDGKGMTDLQLRDEAMTLFIAGFETTAISLSWIIHVLSTHPEVATQLHEQVRSVVGDRLPRFEDLPRLPYLERVIKETLRLYPPAWGIDRTPVSELELGGVRMKPGTDVWVSPWVMHHDPRFWSEPERFNPDRWDADLAAKLPKFAYLPFGGGPRVCIGNAFATMEMQLVAATLVQRFRFAPVEGAAPVPEPGFTLRPNPGVTVRLHRV